MRGHVKTALYGALFGAFIFGAAAPGWAGSLGAAIPQGESGPASLVQQAAHYGPPEGKKCLKWTRRWHSSLGMGHKRCVQWR